ncbi:MAG TPA: hypothetical protein VEG34_09870 [Thermoanaerobaculia bacterium]|nr:hypothetical protein [Thermoanaerobaculia bacterium]
MKSAWIVAVVLLFVSAAGFAAPSPAPLSGEALAAILGPAPAGGACAPKAEGVQLAAARPGTEIKSACNATAQCGSGTVSCSGNSSCSAQDRNCAIPTAGKVTCDGVTTWCSGGCTLCDQCDATGDCMACCQCQGYAYWICERGIC